MSNYLLYGDKLIQNDDTLKDFAQCVCNGVPVCDIQTEGKEEYKEQFMELVQTILIEDISRTDIDYIELMSKYRNNIGEILYDIENNGGDMPVISFFGEAKKSFNELIYKYIYYHFNEMTETI